MRNTRQAFQSLEVVHVEWVDSSAVSSWSDTSELSIPLNHVHSVGILVHQDKEKLVLASAWDFENAHANGVMIIPRCAIKKFAPLQTIKIK
jgi:hypothetical protein